MTVADLVDLNHLADPNRLEVDQHLWVEKGCEPQVAPPSVQNSPKTVGPRQKGSPFAGLLCLFAFVAAPLIAVLLFTSGVAGALGLFARKPKAASRSSVMKLIAEFDEDPIGFIKTNYSQGAPIQGFPPHPLELGRAAVPMLRLETDRSGIVSDGVLVITNRELFFVAAGDCWRRSWRDVGEVHVDGAVLCFGQSGAFRSSTGKTTEHVELLARVALYLRPDPS